MFIYLTNLAMVTFVIFLFQWLFLAKVSVHALKRLDIFIAIHTSNYTHRCFLYNAVRKFLYYAWLQYLFPKSLSRTESYLCMTSLIRSPNHAIYHKAWLFFPLRDNSNVLSCMLLFSSRKVFLHCGANFFSPQAHVAYSFLQVATVPQ